MKQAYFFKQGFLIIFITLILSFSTQALTIQKKSEWPSLNNDTTTIDNNEGIIFTGLGTRIHVFDKNTLLQKTQFDINSKDSILGVIADKKNKILYTAAGKSGIYIIDYSSSENLKIISEISNVAEEPGFLQGEKRSYINPYALTLKDNFLYVADNSYGLRIFDVTEPSKPEYKSGYRNDGKSEKLTTGGFFDLALFSSGSKNYLCILDLFYGLKIFDVTNPEKKPEPVAGKDLRGAFFNNITLVQDIKVKEINNRWYIFVTDKSQSKEQAVIAKLKFINEENTDPGKKFLLKTPQNTGRCDELKKGYAIALYNDYAYVADGKYGIKKIDIINKTGVTDSGVEIYASKSYDNVYSKSYAITLNDATIYSSDLSRGLVSINPDIFSENNSTGELINFKSIDKNEGVICSASESEFSKGFYFFNIENSTEPKILKKLPSSKKAIFVKNFLTGFTGASEEKIYVFKKNSGWETIAEFNLKSEKPGAFEAFENYIIFSADNVLKILKYKEKNIEKIKTVNSASKIFSIYYDPYTQNLYTGNETGIIIYNFKNPEEPSIKDTINTNSKISNIFVSNEYIYSASGNFIYIYDKSMSEINVIDAETEVSSISVDEDFLFAGTSSGIQIYENPYKNDYKLVTTHGTRNKVMQIKLEKSKIYSANSNGGISISEYDKNAGSTPEPFKPSYDKGSGCFIQSLF